MLNEVAWNFFENKKITEKKYLDEALKWSKNSIKINENYFNLDTYAWLLNKSGDYKKAKSFALNAIERAKKDGNDYSSTKQLIDSLKDNKE